MTAVFGITSYGAYIPRLRLDRNAILAAHKWMGGSLKGYAKGARAFCSWDEDSITMAVEAARSCIAQGGRGMPDGLSLASTTLPYADLQNAMFVANAIGLPSEAEIADVTGSQRAGLARLLECLIAERDHLCVMADNPPGKPGSVQEVQQGAGAVAFGLGRDGVLARLVAAESLQAPFVDRFRAHDVEFDYPMEERWVRDEGYMKLIPQAVSAALTKSNLQIADIASLVAPLPLKGGAAALARKLGFNGTMAPSLEEQCGYTGTAHPGLMLAAALDAAQAGDRILVLAFGQGVTAIVLEVTEAIERARRSVVDAALNDAILTTDYLRMLSFNGGVKLDWGARAEKSGKAAVTNLYREAGQIMGFQAGRCGACGTVQFPQLSYCVSPGCNAPAAQFTPHSLADEPAKVLTFTADWLSFYPSPPLYVGFAQFACGARVLMEMVDFDETGPEIGMPLRMAFRIKEPDTIRGFNRYFWKAVPTAAQGS